MGFLVLVQYRKSKRENTVDGSIVLQQEATMRNPSRLWTRNVYIVYKYVRTHIPTLLVAHRYSTYIYTYLTCDPGHLAT